MRTRKECVPRSFATIGGVGAVQPTFRPITGPTPARKSRVADDE